jgi:hypothetical protein
MYPLKYQYRISRQASVTHMMPEQENESPVGQPNLSQSPGQQPSSIAPADREAEQNDQEALTATITYIEGLPTGVEIESVVENVQGWQKRLRDANRPELNEIADHLGSFIKYLTTPDPDSQAVGRSLIQLGELTMKAANNAEAGIGSLIKTLGNWLKKMGESL